MIIICICSNWTLKYFLSSRAGGDNMLCCSKLFIPRIETKNSSEWSDLQAKLARFASLQKRYLHPSVTNNDEENQSASSSSSSSTKSLVNNSCDKDKLPGNHHHGTSGNHDDESSQKLIPIISNNTIMNIEPPLPLDTYEETIQLLHATSSSTSSL